MNSIKKLLFRDGIKALIETNGMSVSDAFKKARELNKGKLYEENDLALLNELEEEWEEKQL